MDKIQIIGIAAGVLTAISMLPQLIKIIKEKKAENISIIMLIVLISGLILWAVYGFLKMDWPIIITNCFSVMVNLLMVFFRIKYKDNK